MKLLVERGFTHFYSATYGLLVVGVGLVVVGFVVITGGVVGLIIDQYCFVSYYSYNLLCCGDWRCRRPNKSQSSAEQAKVITHLVVVVVIVTVDVHCVVVAVLVTETVTGTLTVTTLVQQDVTITVAGIVVGTPTVIVFVKEDVLVTVRVDRKS